jgi:predicted O-linked N-acetylglucosamine transferase (SPINDLY family)
VAFNSDNQHLHMALFNYSIALRQTGDLAGSIQALQNAIAVNKDFAQAYINLGRAFEDCGLIDSAVAQWRNYCEIAGDITAEKLSHRLMAMQHAGRVLEANSRLQEAEDILWEAMELRPDKKESAQHWLAIRQRQCNIRACQIA